ncbi:hypothetical protein [Streptomyces arenae]|uniref:hypothetical protein n=1 Tax=Streptomyces arenae TaxID=29301 RepID=UPI002659B24E|nr:hypothetical protein [Streptomyces arenae]MCG7202806.1 hypothetical protein [Streptomyces arenae]
MDIERVVELELDRPRLQLRQVTHLRNQARDRITSCDDHGTLTTWLTRAATATTTVELFEQPE